MSAASPQAETSLLQQTGACPLCGSAQHRHQYTDTAAPEGQNRELVECLACGLVYVPDARELGFDDLPASAYLNDWELLDLSGICYHYDTLLKAQRLLGIKDNHSPATEPRLLDVGCGAGYFLDHCRAHGWQVTGIEPWREIAAWASKYLKLNVLPTSLARATLEERRFDAVTAHDVLQFCRDPVAFLRRCHALLRPGGVLVATVPNFGSREREALGWQWQQIVPYAHLVYFTADTLRRAAREAGFGRTSIELAGGEYGDAQLILSTRRTPEPAINWTDLSGAIDERKLPVLDRETVDASRLSPTQREWRDKGFLLRREFIPHDLIDSYSAVREKLKDVNGWRSPTPYLFVPEIRELCLYQPLCDILESLFGERMGMNLTLTGWVSTERDWHQDDYLNPPGIMSHYCGVWFALDAISPECGPFEFVPGSHRMPLIRSDKMLALLPETGVQDAMWPWYSERLLTPFFEHEIDRRELPVEQFIAKKGDILIWHSRLLHRGAPPLTPGMPRKAIISHYSSVKHRGDVHKIHKQNAKGYYLEFKKAEKVDTRSPADAIALAGSTDNASEASPLTKVLRRLRTW